MIRIAVQSVDGTTIHLTGPAMAIEAWEDHHRLGRLTDTASALFKRPVTCTFAVDSSAQARPNGNGNDDQDARFALSRHPAVDKIKNLFDGVIVDCRPTQGPVIEDDGDDA